MTDVFDATKRSQVMSRIRGYGNLTTEALLASALRSARITGWRRHVQLRPKLAPGDSSEREATKRISVKPDFMFRKFRLAIFVDGCFWHCCPVHSTVPATNTEFWLKKLGANVERDQRATRALQQAGWTTVRIWEHELADIEAVVDRIRAAMLDQGTHDPAA